MCHEFGTFGERRVSISSGAAAAMSATLETVPVCEGFECVVCCCKLFLFADEQWNTGRLESNLNCPASAHEKRLGDEEMRTLYVAKWLSG